MFGVIKLDDEELNRRTRLPECVHGMVPAWCAECRKISSPEEEELQEKVEFLNNLRSF